jgi:hypothetical protein
MSDVTTVQELTWSAFLREPTSVDALLAKGDVLLKRRDGEPLRLTKAARDDVTSDAIATAARLLAPTEEELLARLAPVVEERLPWTRFLPAGDRDAFVSEFVRQFAACADLGDFTALARLLTEWKTTAALHAEGLAPVLRRPVSTVGARVPRPKK